MSAFAAGLLLILSGFPVWPAPKELLILKPSLSQYEGGQALAAQYKFSPGETVFFSFEVDGYKASPDAKVDLICTIEAFDAKGVKLIETVRKEVKAELAPEDKEWTPKIMQELQLPALLLPGTYRIQARVEDKLAGREAKTKVPIEVKGRPVDPSEALVERNFRFLRNEQDQQALPVAAYRPGNRLWARFEIVGFKYGEKNRIHVEYGISILNAAGKMLYTEPQAAVEDSTSFYPKPYVPGVLSLDLKPKTPAGEYTIILAVRDEVGKQIHESQHTFRIEE